MKAGAEAMITAATSIIATGENSNTVTISSAREIARAIAAIPDRIVVQHTVSEFS